MSSDIAIKVDNLSKCYHIYEQPRDRLKQFVLPRLRQSLGLDSKNYYREFWALKDVSFEVKKGETIGIVGRNGSGKSTLLQLICGTLNPSSGSIQTSGRISALLELGSGFNPEFTGRENVYLSAAVQGLSSEEIREKYADIAHFADIGSFIDQPVRTYSSGMYARLAFSVAIHVDPDILIVDETLAVGDTAFQSKCLNKFYALRDRGCTILFVSHDTYQVRSACSRAIFLKSGAQRGFGPAAQIIDDYNRSLLQSTAPAEPPADTALETANIAEAAAEPPATSCLVRITEVDLLDAAGSSSRVFNTLDTLTVVFKYEIEGKNVFEGLSFVVNLYREDGLYIFGTTTIMVGKPAYPPKEHSTVTVTFPAIPLLAGHYKWRVAVNDHQGLGILAEATPVCEFRMQDGFQAVGLTNLQHAWHID